MPCLHILMVWQFENVCWAIKHLHMFREVVFPLNRRYGVFPVAECLNWFLTYMTCFSAKCQKQSGRSAWSRRSRPASTIVRINRSAIPLFSGVYGREYDFPDVLVQQSPPKSYVIDRYYCAPPEWRMDVPFDVHFKLGLSAFNRWNFSTTV